ncbi:helix-turn-helix domain-containing protein [Nocardia testacea]|uniref:helix-turn-helix domain-containing protein n=1 Tax=Nocardia testacea TaxID=248551 RepID=UPI0033F766E4
MWFASCWSNGGYSGFTVDAVAAKAGVGKAVIYRRYVTKQELIFSVAVHRTDEQPPPDTGSLSPDLVAVSRAFAAQFGRAFVGVFVGLLADIFGDSAVGDRCPGQDRWAGGDRRGSGHREVAGRYADVAVPPAASRLTEPRHILRRRHDRRDLSEGRDDRVTPGRACRVAAVWRTQL